MAQFIAIYGALMYYDCLNTGKKIHSNFLKIRLQKYYLLDVYTNKILIKLFFYIFFQKNSFNANGDRAN